MRKQKYFILNLCLSVYNTLLSELIRNYFTVVWYGDELYCEVTYKTLLSHKTEEFLRYRK